MNCIGSIYNTVFAMGYKQYATEQGWPDDKPESEIREFLDEKARAMKNSYNVWELQNKEPDIVLAFFCMAKTNDGFDNYQHILDHKYDITYKIRTVDTEKKQGIIDFTLKFYDEVMHGIRELVNAETGEKTIEAF